jgi:hypothetical protein
MADHRHWRARQCGILIVVALVAAVSRIGTAADPTTTAPATRSSAQTSAPVDPTLDWLLSQNPTTQSTAVSTTLPAATQVSNPFAAQVDNQGQSGVITLSNGRRIPGFIATTPEQPLRVWDDQAKQYHDLPLVTITKMEAKVINEQEEQEWNFARTGSDVKIFTGKSYPTRETQYIVTLTNGTTITGGIAAPLYVKTDKGSEMFMLHKTDKGVVGQSVGDLVYVKSVEFNGN